MLFDESYNTIESPSGGVYKDRGSKFLAFAYPVRHETEIRELINKIKSEHPKANHHCYAFRIGPGKNVFRYADDREPPGSAGKPIFGVIQSNDLTDILIIVARYFGGTQLGIPGLINAYRSAARDAIHNGNIVSRVITERYRLAFTYDAMNLVMELVKVARAKIVSQQLADDCLLEVELPRSSADDFISKIKNHYQLKNRCEITALTSS